MTTQKVLITGVNGFIGSNIAMVLKSSFKIIGLDTGSTDLSGSVDFYFQMVLPSSDLEGLIKTFEPDYCVHCAGSASVGNSMTSPGMDFNAGPTAVFNLLDSIRKAETKCKVIFLSSAAVYGNPQILPVSETHALKPISPYGYHKMISEKILEEFAEIYGINSIVLRVFSCYGNGLKKQLLWDMANKIVNNKTLELDGSGNETRDFIHVSDLAELIKLMINLKIEKGIYNVAGGKEISINEVASLMIKHLKKQDLEINFSGNNRIGDPLNWVADVKNIKNLGFNPSIEIECGIKNYCEWYNNL